MPDLYMICGPNGAGKSTWSKSVATRHNIVCIDTDALAASGLSAIAAGKTTAVMARTLIANRVSFAKNRRLRPSSIFKSCSWLRSTDTSSI